MGGGRLANLGADGASEDMLWDILSTRPVLNELTVSATFMDPAHDRLYTLLPHASGAGFRAVPESECAARGGAPRVPCVFCRRGFVPALNAAGACSHGGEWHDVLTSCRPACLRIGLSNLGRCHWSCCYSVDRDSPCPRSGEHVAE